MSLHLAAVGVRFAGRDAVADVTATWQRGQLVALLGPNGAGKTSLLRAAAALLPYRGSIRWNDTEIAAMPQRERARLIGYLPQGHLLHWPMPVRDVVALGRFAHGATDPRRLRAEDAAAVDAAMVATGVADFADRAADALSGGERARVALARVLAAQTPVLLADEPTAALDPSHQIAVMETLVRTARAGALVVAVTHDIDLAMAHADHVMLLGGGHVLAQDAPERALTPAALASVFGIRRVDGRMERLP